MEPIYIVDGARTPFLKSRNRPGPFAASDLASDAGRGLLLRQPFDATQVDEVILGCAAPSPDEVNIARVASLRMGCGHKVTAWTVMRNCASGMQAIDAAISSIRAGRSNLVLAGGVDALSRAPLLYSDQMVMWLSNWYAAKSFGQKAALAAKFRPAYLAPVIGLMKGLTDPMVGLLMGQTAENVAYRFGITRAEMDAYAARSHQRVLAAQKAGRFAHEVVALVDRGGKLYAEDDGVREDSTTENLAKLRPFFDRKYGNVTAGNSSQITDGAVWMIIASERAVERHGLTPRARIVDAEWAGIDPAYMGLGPVHAATPILQRHGLGLNDLDAWEINEAFAAQVLGCLRAWEDDAYCRSELGLAGALGSLDEDRLNVDGGAIAIGHPVGASGTRIVLHLVDVLERTNGKRGMAGICIGGGLGGAMLVEKGLTMRHWTITTEGDITTLAFDRADAAMNTLSADVMQELNEALDRFDREPPKALLIRSGKANGFIAGADITEFGAIASEEGAVALVKRGRDTFNRLADARYPTLALIRGYCLGGGLELSLACRYRVAVDEPVTRLGLPEVMLGIVPGWGGITRLPRLVGAPAALDMLLTGKTIDARRAKKLGLVDEAVPQRIMESTARAILTTLPPPRKLPFTLAVTLNPVARRVIASQAAKQVAKRARREHYPAPYAILDLFARYDGNALAVPASDPASLVTLVRSPTTANLLRVFKLQERLKSLGKEGAFTAKRVHVVGAGTMGGDIAAWCALRGLTVTLQDQGVERIAPAIGRAAKLFGERLKEPRRVRDAMDRLIPDVAGDGIARADVIIEAIFESADAKRALFADVEKRARRDAILATNTSSIPLEDIASALTAPSRLIGLHFFNPVAKMMLVEIVVGRDTDRALVPPAAAFVRQIDKLPLPVRSAPGFLVNRILAPYMMAAMRAVDEGLAPETVDEAALAFGMPMGPIELADTVGLDIAVAVGKLLGGREPPPRRLMELVDAKHLGKKSGRGFYVWQGGKAVKQAPGPVPAGLADRLIQPFVAEARAALDEGIVDDADLVDAGAIFGTGFAPFRGGPLHFGGPSRSARPLTQPADEAVV